ncbi:MAG: hypothetical protein PHG00_14030 [Methylococcales bacterium]|nr:hypothetical protein [Methylococcales bacterium]
MNKLSQEAPLPYLPHPISELFPLMSGDELYDLKSDIQEHGLLLPVVMYEGRV